MHEGRGAAQGNITQPRNRHHANLPIVDEVGYIPFDQDDANLFVQLDSSRYEHTSLIVTTNLPFARWGDVFGDLTIAPAIIDRFAPRRRNQPNGTSWRLKGHSTETTTAHYNHSIMALFSYGRSGPLMSRSQQL